MKIQEFIQVAAQQSVDEGEKNPDDIDGQSQWRHIEQPLEKII